MAGIPQVVLPKINTPAENAAIVAESQQAQQVSRQNALTLQKQERDAAERAAVTRVMQETGGDWEQAIPRLRAVSPDLAVKYEKHLSDERASRLGAMKEELTLERTQTERALALLRAIPKGDQELYAQLRAPLARIAPDLEGFLPEQYDPAVIERIQTITESGKEYFARQEQGLDRLAKGEWHQAAAMTLAGAQDGEDWTGIKTMLKEMGAPSVVLQAFGEWSPDAPQRALTIGQTPDKRADNELAREKFTEDTRQFGVTAGQRDRALNLDAAGLQLRRDEAKRSAAGETGAALSAGEKALVEQIVANPAIYHDLTPSAKTKLAGPLAARGFTGFGKAAGGSAKGGPDVGAIFSEIRQLSTKINTSDRGPMSTVTGYIRQKRAGVNLDNDVAEYESLVEGMIPMVARAVGHSGVLTQQDVDSVRAMFPRVGDGKTLASNKLNRIEKLIGGGSSASAPAPSPAPPAQGGGRVVGSGNFAVTAPNGTSYRFQTQALLDEFKRRAAQAGAR